MLPNMESFLSSYFGEMLVAGVLAMFGWGFKSWSSSIKQATDSILTGLKHLQNEFHQHRVDVERRVTRVETKVDIIHEDTRRRQDRQNED